MGWASAHLIMKCVYPSLTIKVVTQAFVCPELCLFQPPRLLFKVTSSFLWPAAIPHWSRLQLPWCFEDFRNSFGNGHSSNISSANCALLRDGKWTSRDGFPEPLMKDATSRLTERIIWEKWWRKSVYSVISFRVADIKIISTGPF